MDRVFHNLGLSNRKALVPFFTAGYPDLEIFVSLVREASGSGADLIEIGIPFSDPIADGPTIQYSSARSLRNGVTLLKTIEIIRELSTSIPTPLLVMSYLNPILRMGISEFVNMSDEAGVSGVIVPDLPVEEIDLLKSATEGTDLVIVPLLAPTSSEERMELVGSQAEGFIYLVSVTGVTGARSRMPKDIPEVAAKVRMHTSVPICLSFGISSPSHVRCLSGSVDGFIVGSAIVDIIRTNGEHMEAVPSIGSFLSAMRSTLDDRKEGCQAG